MFFTPETFLLTIASAIAIAINLVLGLMVFVNDRKNDTNIIFGFLNITLSFYLLSNLFAVAMISPEDKLMWLRLTMFSAVFLDTFFYLFIRIFPDRKLVLFNFEKVGIVVLTSVTAILSLTPFVFPGIIMSKDSIVPTPIVGPAIPLFSLVAILFVGGGIYLIIRKYRQEKDEIMKKRFGSIMAGTIVMFSCFIFLNLLFTVIYDNTFFVKLTPFYTTTFIVFSAYAIMRLGMFNVKVIATELLVFSLWFLIFIRTLFSIDLNDQLMNGGLLVLVVITGIFLIRSVMKEVEQREILLIREKELVESQQREMEKAASVARLKDEFVFIATHELRTPITAIRGFLELVSEAEGDFPADIQEYLDSIKSASDHMNELVNNLLEIARSDADATKIDTQVVDIAPVINEILKEVDSLVQKKGVKVNMNNFKGGVKILADAAKLKEALVNLISNGIKYNKDNGVLEISALREEDTVIIEIRDTGLGIPKVEQEKIFGKFYRATNTRVNEILGTGLGLFITRMLVEKMGGEITFSSVEGEGTTFAISFPGAK